MGIPAKTVHPTEGRESFAQNRSMPSKSSPAVVALSGPTRFSGFISVGRRLPTHRSGSRDRARTTRLASAMVMRSSGPSRAPVRNSWKRFRGTLDPNAPRKCPAASTMGTASAITQVPVMLPMTGAPTEKSRVEATCWNQSRPATLRTASSGGGTAEHRIVPSGPATTRFTTKGMDPLRARRAPWHEAGSTSIPWSSPAAPVSTPWETDRNWSAAAPVASASDWAESEPWARASL